MIAIINLPVRLFTLEGIHLSETYYVDGKPVSVTRYDESGKPIGTFGPDGKPLGSSPATTTTTLPNAQ
jgi:hypothetical protein